MTNERCCRSLRPDVFNKSHVLCHEGVAVARRFLWLRDRPSRSSVLPPRLLADHRATNRLIARRVYRLMQLLTARDVLNQSNDDRVARRCVGYNDTGVKEIAMSAPSVLNGYTWPDEGTRTEEFRGTALPLPVRAGQQTRSSRTVCPAGSIR